jgi:hypothetical protein
MFLIIQTPHAAANVVWKYIELNFVSRNSGLLRRVRDPVAAGGGTRTSEFGTATSNRAAETVRAS